MLLCLYSMLSNEEVATCLLKLQSYTAEVALLMF